MAALSEDLKLLVVTRLAAFVPPAKVAEELKQGHGVEASLQQLSAYDPGNVAGRRMSQELRRLFEETRARYLSDLSDVPLAHLGARVRFLSEIATEAKAGRNLGRALAATEQIAKDVGGVYNRLSLKEIPDDQLCRILGLPPPGGPAGIPPGGGGAPGAGDGGGAGG